MVPPIVSSDEVQRIANQPALGEIIQAWLLTLCFIQTPGGNEDLGERAENRGQEWW